MVHMASSTDREWKAHGACQRHPDPSVWFPDRGENLKTIEAKRICSGCPVKTRCLEHAVLTVQNFGIWGGAGDPVRRYLRRINLNRSLLEAETTCPHPGETSRDGCACPYCLLVLDHFARLAVLAETGRGPDGAWNINGPGAQHGKPVTYARGCKCGECKRVGRRSDAA